MNGPVDDDLRALLEVRIGSAPSGGKSTVLVWVDTAFNKWNCPRTPVISIGSDMSIVRKSSLTMDLIHCWVRCYSTVTTCT